MVGSLPWFSLFSTPYLGPWKDIFKESQAEGQGSIVIDILRCGSSCLLKFMCNVQVFFVSARLILPDIL